jgi:hypothetical protein
MRRRAIALLVAARSVTATVAPSYLPLQQHRGLVGKTTTTTTTARPTTRSATTGGGPTSTETTSPSPDESGGGSPGFGVAPVVVALAGAALWRRLS